MATTEGSNEYDIEQFEYQTDKIKQPDGSWEVQVLVKSGGVIIDCEKFEATRYETMAGLNVHAKMRLENLKTQLRRIA